MPVALAYGLAAATLLPLSSTMLLFALMTASVAPAVARLLSQLLAT